ncbi:hypothetical protein H8E77_40010 [bacterium]|nr:hypothetical protein [bacterium]
MEELVAEWLQLDDYLIEISLPVSVAQAGGRYRADVVGAKVNVTTLEIKHVECGTLGGGDKSIMSLDRKFSSQNCQYIEQHFRSKMGFNGQNVKYEKTYITNYWSKPTIAGAINLGINVITLPVFICSNILPTIEKWKRNWIIQRKLKTKNWKTITLPESCWLLKLIEDLYRMELLTCARAKRMGITSRLEVI